MEVKASWAGGLRFETLTENGHTVVTDVPADGGGADTAATPMQVVLAGLAACAGVDVVSILERMRQPLAELAVTARAERADDHPRVFTEIKLVFAATGAVDASKLERAVRLSHDKYCSVAAMLGRTARITTEVVVEPE